MLHDYHKTERIFSQYDFSALHEKLLETGRVIYLEKGVTIKPERQEIYFILAGTMLVQNKISGGLALGHTCLYMPVGLLERHYGDIALYYNAETPVKAVALSGDELDNIFLHFPDTAILFMKIVSHMMMNLIQIYYERNADSGYTTIRHMLCRYQARRNNVDQTTENITRFILNRTCLSRSYVFKILAELKEAGYITVKYGKLISINKEIPHRS
jgi:cAMP-binding proteins - catabolite gene activator and regulatory subunit of cAMP-dependent protein kinases